MGKNRKTQDKIINITLVGLLAALVCVATMVIQIQSPISGGYKNFGDCFVLLSGWLLGPVFGGLAAGIGSMFAEILSGYAHYALPTFLIKSLMAVCAYFVFQFLQKLNKNEKPTLKLFSRIMSGIAAELVMILGYFLCNWFFKGNIVNALWGIPGDCVQALIGIISSVIIAVLLEKTNRIKFYHR